MSGRTTRPPAPEPPPLCVTMDALVPGDRLVEDVLSRLKTSPALLLRLPRWAARGRALARAEIAAVAAPEARYLPYDRALLDRVQAARREGRSTALVASDAEYGEAVRRHLGVFDELLTTNGSGTSLRAVLTDRFGESGFDLIGRGAERVDASREFHEAVRGKPDWRVLLRAVRAHQWLKNALIFLPVLGAQQFTNRPVLFSAAMAFIAFSLVASSVYVMNDLLDLREDRRHISKRSRPFASGRLPLSWAPFLVTGLLAVAITVSVLLLPRLFWLTLGGYFVLTFAYSIKLKGAVLIDVLTLAGLYTMRVLAGSAATGIEPSVWLLGFCMFFFLSLALVKRYAELQALGSDSEPTVRLPGRGYQPGDLPVLVALGVGTGCISVLVLALYVISDEMAIHYSYPFLVWLLCPLALYWMGRAWLVVARDEMHDDPLVWAVRDQLSRWVVITAVILLILAR